jgi:hypothetical protein
VHGLRQGVRGGILLRGPRRLPVLKRPPHGLDRRPPRRNPQFKSPIQAGLRHDFTPIPTHSRITGSTQLSAESSRSSLPLRPSNAHWICRNFIVFPAQLDIADGGRENFGRVLFFCSSPLGICQRSALLGGDCRASKLCI